MISVHFSPSSSFLLGFITAATAGYQYLCLWSRECKRVCLPVCLGTLKPVPCWTTSDGCALCQINLVPGLSFEVTVNCTALRRKMLVQCRNNKQLP